MDASNNFNFYVVSMEKFIDERETDPSEIDKCSNFRFKGCLDLGTDKLIRAEGLAWLIEAIGLLCDSNVFPFWSTDTPVSYASTVRYALPMTWRLDDANIKALEEYIGAHVSDSAVKAIEWGINYVQYGSNLGRRIFWETPLPVRLCDILYFIFIFLQAKTRKPLLPPFKNGEGDVSYSSSSSSSGSSSKERECSVSFLGADFPSYSFLGSTSFMGRKTTITTRVFSYYVDEEGIDQQDVEITERCLYSGGRTSNGPYQDSSSSESSDENDGAVMAPEDDSSDASDSSNSDQEDDCDLDWDFHDSLSKFSEEIHEAAIGSNSSLVSSMTSPKLLKGFVSEEKGCHGRVVRKEVLREIADDIERIKGIHFDHFVSANYTYVKDGVRHKVSTTQYDSDEPKKYDYDEDIINWSAAPNPVGYIGKSKYKYKTEAPLDYEECAFKYDGSDSSEEGDVHSGNDSDRVTSVDGDLYYFFYYVDNNMNADSVPIVSFGDISSVAYAVYYVRKTLDERAFETYKDDDDDCRSRIAYEVYTNVDERHILPVPITLKFIGFSRNNSLDDICDYPKWVDSQMVYKLENLSGIVKAVDAELDSLEPELFPIGSEPNKYYYSYARVYADGILLPRYGGCNFADVKVSTKIPRCG